MSWSYRVIRSEDPITDTFMSVHEVYYNKAGEIWGWSEKPVSPGGADMNELGMDFSYFADALKEPVLEHSDLPEGEPDFDLDKIKEDIAARTASES